MYEFLPVLIVGSIIGAFALIFIIAYGALKKQKEENHDRYMSDGELIRRLLTYAKPYWKEFILVFLIMVISIVYDLVSPLIIGDIEKTVTVDFELNDLYQKVGIYAGILIVSMICTFCQTMILQKIGE